MRTVRPDRAAVIEAMVRDASAGKPGLLCIEGESGMGKSTHLSEVLESARDFRLLSAQGMESDYRPAYGILEQLGLPGRSAHDGRTLNPAVAAQSLRRLMDPLNRAGALLIAIDDAQWADEESLEALRLVLGRLSGDRVLAVVAHRPFARGEHRRWRHWCEEPGVATRIKLTGIDLDEAAQLVCEVAGAKVPGPLVERIWQHTGGNPLHLNHLVAEYGWEQLDAMPDLPAPEALGDDLRARVEAMDPDAARLLRAVAVVGSSWVDPVDAASIAGVEPSAASVDLLVEAGLLVTRNRTPLADVRIVHTLIRAAVYQSIPGVDRRLLHSRAALVLTLPMARLEQAVAAAERRDDALAEHLEQAAREAHREWDYRREAQLLTWAAQLSESPARREWNWLEAQIATVLALGTRSVRAHLSEIGWAADVAHRTLVLAWLLVVENRIAAARRTLSVLSADALAASDPRVRTRLLVLKAWTMLMSGRPTSEVEEILAEVPEISEQDPAIRSYFLRAAGQVAARQADFDHIRQDFAAAPDAAHTTRLDHTDKLAWRGSVYSMCGFAAEARRDLGEVVSRIKGGMVDAGSGATHGLYGFALWLDGEFDRAGVEFQAAIDLTPDLPHPIVQAALSLVPSVLGDFEDAERLLAESREVLRELPWHEAVCVLSQAQIVRLQAGDDDAARRGCLEDLREVFGEAATSPLTEAGGIWHLHLALASIWAGELEAVEQHLSAIETDMIVPGWIGWVRPWLIGLREERRQDHVSSRRHLLSAVAAQTSELPLYRAHVMADLARVEARLADNASAATTQSRAAELYRRLGATAYVSRYTGNQPAPARLPDVLDRLSDREREVASLVLIGYSYAQVAEELYVTRSTVAFHLGNIYAKTGVASRHQLIEAVRAARTSTVDN